MQLIARRSFRNVNGAIAIENAVHPQHIEIGTRFSIGGDASLKELERTDQSAAKLAVMLLMAKCVAEPTPEVVATIQAEVAQDRRREANRAAQAMPAPARR
jgi:hypothetical protein